MKCDDFKLLMVDALYDEISEDNRRKLDGHLKRCKICCEEFASLRATSNTLKKWEDVDPKTNLIFNKETKSLFSEFIEKFRPIKILYGLGIAFASILLILSIANTRIKVQDGDFDLQMNLFKTSYQEKVSSEVTIMDLEKLRRENLDLISHLLDEYSRQQKIETAMFLDEFYRNVEYKRQTDLKLVSGVLKQVHYDTEKRLNRTDEALGSLIRYVNLQSQAGQRIER